MKYLIILGDGMSDYPIKSLGGKTPLQAAQKPHIDRLAKLGKNGLLKTIPDDMPTGSAVANMQVLGYDSHKYFSGRGVLEAANMGIALEKNDLALRCNLINVTDDEIKSHSAEHITTEEAKELLKSLNEKFTQFDVKIHTGLSYKHLLVVKNGNDDLECFPPHDFPNHNYKELFIKANSDNANKTAELLNNLIKESHLILKEHPINIERQKKGKLPANLIWPWSPGKKPDMPLFKNLFGKNGAVISAVDLINGLGIYAGMDIIKVEGATGLYDTNYEGKAMAAIEALKTHDFVYLHIEATDEAGHEGNIELKTKCIENLDERITKIILENCEAVGDDLTIAVLPDHPTPAELRTHTRDAVPFIIYNKNMQPDEVQVYDEKSAQKGFYGLLERDEFMKALFDE